MNSVYERALKEVGQNGRFQKRFDVVYNFFFTLLWAMAYNSMILALVITPHSCEVPIKPENVSELIWKSKYIPMSTDATGRTSFSSCEIFINPGESNSTKACDAYIYDSTWYESTVPSVNNWVCDNELNVANIFAYGKIGEAFGSVTFGWFGDLYGRRLAYIISLAFLVFGRFMSILSSNSYALFAIGCVIAWFPSWTVEQSVTVISMEISSQERRSAIAILRTISYSSGMCIMPLLYWWLRDWKTFMIVTTSSQIPFLLMSWNILESPRWLWVEGKAKACIKELNRIAKVNNTTLEKGTKNEIFSTRPPNNNQTLGPLALFSSWRLAFHTSLQLYLWVSVTLGYVVLIMSSGEKSDGNPFLEFAWQSMAEVPATFLGAWLADNFGRRHAGAVSYFISALMWTIIFFRELGFATWLQGWWVGPTLIIINRFATTVSYYVIYLLNMEIYPTCLRQSGIALGNVFASIGSAIAPYLMYIGRRIDSRLPGAVLCLVTLVGAVSVLLLPETLNSTLPETIKDAQEFGRRDTYEPIKLKTISSSTSPHQSISK